MQTESNWRNEHKYIKPTTEGTCPYCKKHVKALEAHMHDKHKKELQREKK